MAGSFQKRGFSFGLPSKCVARLHGIGHWLPPAKSITDHSRWLIFVLFYAVFVNLPYWVASKEFGFLHSLGWFCTEFTIVGLIALVVPPVFSAVLLLSVIAADLVCAICVTYNLSIPVCLANISVYHALSGFREYAAVTIVLIALLMAAFAAHMPGTQIRGDDRWRAATCLIVFAVLTLTVDFVTVARAIGHLPNPLRMSAVTDGIDLNLFRAQRFARIPIVRLVHLDMVDEVKRENEEAGGASMSSVPSASAAAISYARLASGNRSKDLPNLVLVVLESWGFATDLPLNNALLQPYLDPALRARYQVVQGTVPFHGATIAGEARELCGASFGFHILNASATELKDCLPARLAALGYHDIALHGMEGSMFDRSTWYRTIGFQELWFKNRFRQQGLPDCMGALIGTCDSNVAEWIERRLEKQNANPYFIHWMTLNSHLPVLVPATLPAGAPCLSSLSLTPETPMCSWYQLVANVHQSVIQIAMGTLARPTIFIIVGDHAPPFVDPELRSRFSNTVVPYVLLLPRTDNDTPSQILAHNTSMPPKNMNRHSRLTP